MAASKPLTVAQFKEFVSDMCACEECTGTYSIVMYDRDGNRLGIAGEVEWNEEKKELQFHGVKWDESKVDRSLIDIPPFP